MRLLYKSPSHSINWAWLKCIGTWKKILLPNIVHLYIYVFMLQPGVNPEGTNHLYCWYTQLNLDCFRRRQVVTVNAKTRMTYIVCKRIFTLISKKRLLLKKLTKVKISRFCLDILIFHCLKDANDKTFRVSIFLDVPLQIPSRMDTSSIAMSPV